MQLSFLVGIRKVTASSTVDNNYEILNPSQSATSVSSLVGTVSELDSLIFTERPRRSPTTSANTRVPASCAIGYAHSVIRSGFPKHKKSTISVIENIYGCPCIPRIKQLDYERIFLCSIALAQELSLKINYFL